MTDIVKTQLLLAQGASLDDCGLPTTKRDPELPPPVHSIQLRITAENVQNDWSLSIGKITSFQFPTGNGIRVDTHLISGHPAVVSADFDSLVAKVIVTASSWKDTVSKALRALNDTQITGIKTNIDILRAIVAHPDFLRGQCDTQWLENKQKELLELGQRISASNQNSLSTETTSSSATASVSAANTLFRKGDAWSLTLSSPSTSTEYSSQPPPHHLELTRVLRNEFPTSLSAELLFTTPATSANAKPQSTPYTITLSSTSASAAAATSHHRRGNPSDPSHINIPFPGKLVEVLVDEGDEVKEGDVLCVVQQMKMELEVRSPRSGRITWVMEAEEGEDIAEGTLAVIVEKTVREARL
jgi:acetyl/propionyl-CoA carboxylase alpha subunit